MELSEGDLVMVEYVDVREIGAFVELLDHDRRRAFMSINEFSRRRLRSLTNYATVGAKDVMHVVRVNSVTGDVDVSRKNITPEDIEACKTQHEQANAVRSILRARWPGDEAHQKQVYEKWVESAESAGAESVAQWLLDSVGNGSDSALDALVLKHLGSKRAAREVERHVELTCFGPDGIDAIRGVIKSGLRADETVRITLVASPVYRVVGVSQGAVDRVIEVMQAAAPEWEDMTVTVRESVSANERASSGDE